IEYEGTYPLPEAQLDRFILKLDMGYPSFADELELLGNTSKNHPIETIEAVMSREELINIQEEVKEVYIDTTIQSYIVNIVKRTREDAQTYLGVSPRGSIALMKAAKAYAYINGRDYVLPDDVKYLAPYVLSHRMIITSEGKYDGATGRAVIESILKTTHIPVRKEFS